MLTSKTLKRFRSDPVFHIETVQGVKTLEVFQKRICMSVAQHERTVVSACHDVGKTFTASKVVLWFTSTFKGAKIITTAPTFNQVKRLLWSEIRSGYARSKYPLGGEMLMTEWKITEDWFALGFTSRGEQTEGEGQGKASSFQGWHAPSLLVVFDEATGIPDSIWTQMEGLMTSAFVRFLAIGNPTTKSCEFFKCFNNPAYHKIKLSCFDSPNFHANKIYSLLDLEKEYDRMKELSQDQQYEGLQKYKVPNKHLLTLKWVMQMVLKWGMKHPLVVSKCFGEFPEEDEWTLITLGSIEKAQYRTYEPKSTDRVSIGVDVARSGSDSTVITRMVGCRVIERKVLVKKDGNQVSGEIVRMVGPDLADVHIVVDETGVGSAVVDGLRSAKQGKFLHERVEIRGVHFGATFKRISDPHLREQLEKKFVNLKARIFVTLSEDIKSSLVLLTDDIYAEELPTIHYEFDAKGRWVIESKDEYKKRTGRGSPDTADSLALANFGRYEANETGDFGDQQLQDETDQSIIQYSTEKHLW